MSAAARDGPSGRCRSPRSPRSQNVRRDEEHNEVEMLMPVVAEVFGNIGITKDDVDFICSGSTDYLIGGPFSFVTALDAVGVWPPRSESHVEMDGAWALYEAWVLLQEGEIDAALVYSFGRSSLGNLNEILALQLDPYYLAPLWPDPVSLAALQARALIDAGKGTEAEFAAIAARSRKDALANPKAQVANDVPVDDAAGGRVRGLAAAAPRPAARSPTVPPPSCWPPATRPGDGRSEPAWITGFDHRMETHSLGARDLTSSPSTAKAADGGRGGRRPGRRGRAPRPLRPPGDHRAGGPRASTTAVAVNPSGGAAGRQPAHVGRPHPHRRGRRPDLARGRPAGRWPTPPRARACNRTWSASWRVSDGRALRSHRRGPDPPQGQAGRRVHRRPGPGGGQDGPGRRRPRPGRTSTPWSSARPRTCSRAT